MTIRPSLACVALLVCLSAAPVRAEDASVTQPEARILPLPQLPERAFVATVVSNTQKWRNIMGFEIELDCPADHGLTGPGPRPNSLVFAVDPSAGPLGLGVGAVNGVRVTAGPTAIEQSPAVRRTYDRVFTKGQKVTLYRDPCRLANARWLILAGRTAEAAPLVDAATGAGDATKGERAYAAVLAEELKQQADLVAGGITYDIADEGRTVTAKAGGIVLWTLTVTPKGEYSGATSAVARKEPAANCAIVTLAPGRPGPRAKEVVIVGATGRDPITGRYADTFDYRVTPNAARLRPASQPDGTK